MAKFKHINGGIAEVFTEVNINRLEHDKNYERIQENASNDVNKTTEEENTEESVEVEESLQ